MVLKNTRHIHLFNLIAHPYQWFYNSQLRTYRLMLKRNLEKLNLKEKGTILDLGCGTGAFAKSFMELGYNVKGIDAANRMVKIAKQNQVQAIHHDFLQPIHFLDNSFDLVIMANVAHGITHTNRLKLYKEALRLSKGKVLIHDYNKKRRFAVTIIEWFENGDYKNFINQIPDEFLEVFTEMDILDEHGTSAWYLCYG